MLFRWFLGDEAAIALKHPTIATLEAFVLTRTKPLKTVDDDIVLTFANGIITDVDARRWIRATLEEAARLADEIADQQGGDIGYGARLVAFRLREMV
jgi:hypothetical protein